MNTATVPLLTSTIRQFREIHSSTQVEVIGAQQAQIQRAILDGSFDPFVERARAYRGAPADGAGVPGPVGGGNERYPVG